jgi:hypothetical protein
MKVFERKIYIFAVTSVSATGDESGKVIQSVTPAGK